MNEKIEVLHQLCHELMKELEDVNEKISRGGGMSAGDLETVDKLTHAIKSVKTTIAMMESEDGGYSGYYPMRRSYADGRGGASYRGNSYARGRVNARRDSMGRYSGNGYSYAEGMEELLNEMRDMLPGMSEEKRRKAERLIDELQG